MSILFRDLRIWLSRVSECHDPSLLYAAMRHDWQRQKLLTLATHQPVAETLSYIREVEDDHQFVTELRQKLAALTSYKPRAIDFMITGRGMLSGSVFFNETTLYAIVRTLKPMIMIETGGTPGKSTAFILRAMERNQQGHLYTIDLPPTETAENKLADVKTFHQQRPSGTGSNWIVPEGLRKRHTLLQGKSSEHLPVLLAQLEYIDIFLHDSDHSYENMMWEFETALPKLKPDGLLLSDDVLANTSFFDFCDRQTLQRANVFNLGTARRSNS